MKPMTQIQEQSDWPEPEIKPAFDWSLSMGQIEKKYGKIEKPEKVQAEKILPEVNNPEEVQKYFRKLETKFPYLFSLIPIEVTEWIYRNPKI